MTDVYVVETTHDDRAKADDLAAALVERRLAACVQIVPGMTSLYWWRGKVEREEELLILVKTAKPAEVEAAVAELHSYDEPEILTTRVDSGSTGYLRWVADETAAGA